MLEEASIEADRGQTIGMAIFLLALIAFAIVFGMLLNPMEDTHSDLSNQTTNQTAQDGLDNSIYIIRRMPLIVTGIGAISLIMFSIVTGRI